MADVRSATDRRIRISDYLVSQIPCAINSHVAKLEAFRT